MCIRDSLYSEESFWGCPLYDVVAKAKSLDRASECWSLLYIFLGVVPSNFWVQLEHSLVGLLANPFFLRYSILLCRLRTDKFPQSVVILNVNSSKEFGVCIKLYILDMSLDFSRRLQEPCIDLIDSQWLETLLENYDSHKQLWPSTGLKCLSLIHIWRCRRAI